MTIPDDLATWPRELQLQWLADELWASSTNEQDPAPSRFVEDLRVVLIWTEAMMVTCEKCGCPNDPTLRDKCWKCGTDLPRK